MCDKSFDGIPLPQPSASAAEASSSVSLTAPSAAPVPVSEWSNAEIARLLKALQDMGEDKPMLKLAEKVNAVPKGRRAARKPKSHDDIAAFLAEMRRRNREEPDLSTSLSSEPGGRAEAPTPPVPTVVEQEGTGPIKPTLQKTRRPGPPLYTGQHNIEDWLDTTTAILMKGGVKKDRSLYLADALNSLATESLTAHKTKVKVGSKNRQVFVNFSQVFRYLSAFTRGQQLPVLGAVEAGVLVEALEAVWADLDSPEAEERTAEGRAFLHHLAQAIKDGTLSVCFDGEVDESGVWSETRSLNPLGMKAEMVNPELEREACGPV